MRPRFPLPNPGPEVPPQDRSHMKDRDMENQRLVQVPALDLSEPLERKASHKEPPVTGPLLGKFWRQKGKKAAARRRPPPPARDDVGHDDDDIALDRLAGSVKVGDDGERARRLAAQAPEEGH